jgi:hypothetical protein
MSLQDLQNKVSALEQEASSLRSEYNSVESQREAAFNAAERARANLLASGLDPATDENYQQLAQQSFNLSRQAQNLSNGLSRANQNLAIAKESLQREQRTQSQQNNATSAGAVVAASDDAGVVNPNTPTQRLQPNGRINQPGTNAQATNANEAVTTATAAGSENVAGGNLSVEDTQAPLKAPNTGEVKRIVEEPPPDAPTPPRGAYGPGVGAAGDDGQPTKNLTRQDIELNFNEDIIPQSNILDKYASYSYQISLCLCNERDYRTLLTTKRDDASAADFGNFGIFTGQLLIQSGGIAEQGTVKVNIPGRAESDSDSDLGSSRNRYFQLDYFIDSVSIKNIFQGRGSGTASSYTDLRMTVIEPNGISLIDNLKAAVRDYVGINSFASAIYLLVIRWKGYDENGNIVYAGNTDSGSAQTDPYTIAIKYVPFCMTNIKFSVTNSLTTYEIAGRPIIYNFPLRQVVPYNTEIAGQTVNEMLGGVSSAAVSTTAARTNGTLPGVVDFGQGALAPQPGGAGEVDVNAGAVAATPSTYFPGKLNSAPTGSNGANRGLMPALNAYQGKLVQDGVYEIADEFSIEFVNASIANATIKKPGDLTIDKTPMGDNSQARALLDSTNQMKNTYRNFGITAGQSIVQVIEMVVRNSSFVGDQQLRIVDEETQQVKDNGTPIENFAWFKISLLAEPKGYDGKRNDYAYKFKFLVSIYEVKSINSVWFPRTKFRGVHKSYPYWFTGKNTAVLEYTQSFDNLYQNVISGAADQALATNTTALTEIPRYVYQPRSAQSSQGADGRANEPAANAADYLYSPTDLGKIRVRIVGDPAWMQQGEILRGNDARTFSYKAFNPDGTINFESQEVLFEIVWQRPVDYDVNGDGLMNPNHRDPNSVVGARESVRSGPQSYVFYATSCTSEFNRGRFEQNLEGGIYIFTRNKNIKVNQDTVNTGTRYSNNSNRQDPRVSALPPVISNENTITAGVNVQAAPFTPAGVNVQNAFFNNPGNENLTYNGDDATVRASINVERIQRGLPPLTQAQAVKPI